MRRYWHAALYSVLSAVLGYFMFLLTGNGARWLYSALKDWFPRVFNNYSPVLEAEKFERAQNTVLMIGSVLAVFFTALIVTRLDNGRNEYIISETEGFYHIPDVLPLYYKRYTLPDLAASLLSTVLISVPVISAQEFVPEEINWFSNMTEEFKSMHIGLFFGEWNYTAAAVFVFALSFASKMLAGLSGLKKWRAAWLTYN